MRLKTPPNVVYCRLSFDSNGQNCRERKNGESLGKKDPVCSFLCSSRDKKSFWPQNASDRLLAITQGFHRNPVTVRPPPPTRPLTAV